MKKKKLSERLRAARNHAFGSGVALDGLAYDHNVPSHMVI